MPMLPFWAVAVVMVVPGGAGGGFFPPDKSRISSTTNSTQTTAATIQMTRRLILSRRGPAIPAGAVCNVVIGSRPASIAEYPVCRSRIYYQ
jgi:hypothetical protein